MGAMGNLGLPPKKWKPHVMLDNMAGEAFMLSPKTFTAALGILGIVFLTVTGPLFADQDEIPPPPNDRSLITSPTYDNPTTPYLYKVPRALSDGWKVGDLRQEKTDLDKMTRGVGQIRSGIIPDVHSLLVLRHGKLLLEEYFNRQKSDEAQPLFSCTKSVFSTVYGIAQDQGLLRLDRKIYDDYPVERSKAGWDSRKDAITVGMLLSMTSGLDCNDVGIGSDNCGADMAQTSDWLSFAHALPMAHPPGEVWTYNGCCLVLLSDQIARQSGMSFPQYADKYLLEPLGIECKGWVTGPQGVIRVDYGLSWKPRDMAKLGQLYLNRGLWEGKRIVSEAWIKDATRVHAPLGKAFGHDYGYLWHIKNMRWKDRSLQVFYALGLMGQVIFVSPDADMVCVMTAGSHDPQIYSMEEGFFENTILGAFN